MVLKELIFTVSILGGCGSLERTDFYILTVVSTLRGCGGLERTDFLQFLFGKSVVVLKELIFYSFLCWKGVVVLKELIFNSFYFGRVWWS